jgi:hypothetical protein
MMVRRLKTILNKRAAGLPGGSSFRKRYDDVERRRAEMLQRLDGLDAKARTHPAFARASALLNQTFRKASVAQRVAVLSAAEWIIDLLERMTMII